MKRRSKCRDVFERIATYGKSLHLAVAGGVMVLAGKFAVEIIAEWTSHYVTHYWGG